MGRRSGLIALALALLVGLPGPARGGPTTYTGFVIDEIRFDAPPSVEVEELAYLVELTAGEELRPGDVRRSIELLHGLGLFREVSVSVVPDGVRLIVTFHLEPSPTLRRIAFRGLPSAVPRAVVREALPLREGEPFFEGDEVGLGEALVDLLVGEGFVDARVSASHEPMGEEQVRVVLEVDPGTAYRLSEVRFNEAAGLPTRTLRMRIGAAAMEGGRLRQDAVDQAQKDLQKLYRKRGYLEARFLPPTLELDPATRTASATFNILPGAPAVVEFRESTDPERAEADQILAPRGVASRRLRAVIGIEREHRINAGYLQDAMDRIEDHYRERGHYAVQVTGEIEEVHGERRLVFRIHTGPQAVLANQGDIRVLGSDVLPEREVRLMVVERLPRRANRASPLRRLRITEAALDLAQDDLRTRYQSMGYLGVEVDRDPVERIVRRVGSLERSLVTLRIREGARTHVRDVEVRGNLRVDTDEIRELARPLIGEPLQRPEIERVLDRLRALYGERGCVDVVVRSTEDLSEDTTEATLIWSIVEGQQVRYGKVLVRGNRHTRTRLIRNELSIRPGHLWRPAEVEQSRRRLLESTLFGQVGIRPLNTSGRVRDVLLEVSERKRWRLLLGPGISTSEGLRLAGESHLGNLGGVGHRWSTFAHVGIDWESLRLALSPAGDLAGTQRADVEWKIVTGYEIAHFPRVPLRLNIRVLLNERALQPTYIIQNYGLGVGAAWTVDLKREHELRLAWDFQVLWRYPEYVDPAAVLSPADRMDEDFRSGFLGLIGSEQPPDGLRRLGLFRLTAQLDFRDDRFNPTAGVLVGLDLEGTDLSPLSQEQFGRFRQRLAFYLPLIRWAREDLKAWPFNVASRIDWGIGWLGPDSEMLPVEYRFRLGGATSVRGYRLETLGPTVTRSRDLGPAGLTSSQISVPVGGDVYFSFNIEERFPLTRSRSVELIVFQDGGNAYLLRGADREDLDRGLDPVIRTSAGLGIRIRTPVGPLRLDGGIQLGRASPLFDPASEEPWWRGMAIHFSVGEQ